MEQHPVPQHIASFEFKLFGNLTVRQFVTLAIPLSLAAAIFFSSLPTLVRFPASALIAIFAFIAALVPISGRPLHKWVIAFIRAILSPTQRIWIKESAIPQFLSVVVAPPPPETPADQTITAGGREKLRQYLRSLPKEPLTPLDVKEQLAVQRLELEGLPSVALSVVEGAKEGKLPPPIIWPQAISLPQITPSGPEALWAGGPQITPGAKPYVLPGLEKKLQKAPAGPKAKLASEANFAVESVIPIRTFDKQIKLIHGVGKTRVRKLHFAPPAGFNLSRLPIRGEKRFEISEELKRRFQFDESLFAPTPASRAEPAPPASTRVERGEQGPQPSRRAVPKPRLTTDTTQGVLAKTASSPNLAATISQSWPKSAKLALAPDHLVRAQIIPLTNRPNVISGITTAPDGTPLPNAILIVKDTTGIPKRAVKTNKLGQFLSATPLENGTYTVEIESELHTFAPFTLNLTGQVLAPLEIKAKQFKDQNANIKVTMQNLK